MRSKGILSDLLVILLLAVSGATAGLAAGVLLGGRLAARLEIRTDGLIRAADMAAYESAASVMTGIGGIFFPAAGLALATALGAFAVVLALRGRDRKGSPIVWLAVGLLVGSALAGASLFFAGATERIITSLTSASFNDARVFSAAAWPRVVYAGLFGTTVGLGMGALLASTWLRRALFILLAVSSAAVAAIVGYTARPGVINVPAAAPELHRGADADQINLYVIGGSEQAEPIKMSLSLFTDGSAKTPPLRVGRRNVARAQKVVKVLPVLHPRSATAEKLLVAGALSKLDVEGAVAHLWNGFMRRGNHVDGMLLATTLGRMAPTEAALQHLTLVADQSKVHVGEAAAKRLCPLARASGRAELVKQLSCEGAASAAPTGVVKGTLKLNGRPMKRTPVALVAEPMGGNAEWVKKGQVSAGALALVAGTRTDGSGGFTLPSIPEGSYLLAVSPRRRGPPRPFVLSQAVSINVPAAGGDLELGEIGVGRPPPERRNARQDTEEGEEEGSSETAAQDDATASEGENPDGGEDTQGNDAEAERPAPRLPPSARRLIEEIRSLGQNRVAVPAGFGQKVLNADRSAFAPGATVSPVTEQTRTGVALQGIRPGGVAETLGFRDGDVVLSVNGRAVSTADEIVDLVEHLEGTRRISIRVRREGRPLALRIDVQP